MYETNGAASARPINRPTRLSPLGGTKATWVTPYLSLHDVEPHGSVAVITLSDEPWAVVVPPKVKGEKYQILLADGTGVTALQVFAALKTLGGTGTSLQIARLLQRPQKSIRQRLRKLATDGFVQAVGRVAATHKGSFVIYQVVA